MKGRLAASAALLTLSLCAAAQNPSAWRAHVPEKDRVQIASLPQTTENAAAGRELYHRNCAACHGDDGQGRGHKPALHGQRMQSTTDGELFWLLRNGSLAHGMPSWSRLPEAQRWQLIQYLRTLPE